MASEENNAPQRRDRHGGTSTLGKAVRMVTRVTLTLGVAAGAVFAVQMGASSLSQRADAAVSTDVAPTIPVSTRALQQEDSYTIVRRYVGQVEPQRTVTVSFELGGRLADILVDEGDWVDAGQLLATQDVSLLRAEEARLTASRAATEAQRVFASQTVERNSELNTRGFASQAGLDEALARERELSARLLEIDAALQDVAIRLGKTEIRAPFAGRVTARQVDGGETLSPGQAILGLVALQAPQVRIGVPLALTEADLTNARIEVGGVAHQADLIALRPDIDPVTRTRTALFEIAALDQPLFGQTARLLVAEEIDATGFWLPTTSLKEGLRGQWTVLTVDPSQTVRTAVVEILHATSDRVFVRAALPEGTRLIDQGPQRVTAGQKVSLARAD